MISIPTSRSFDELGGLLSVFSATHHVYNPTARFYSSSLAYCRFPVDYEFLADAEFTTNENAFGSIDLFCLYGNRIMFILLRHI